MLTQHMPQHQFLIFIHCVATGTHHIILRLWWPVSTRRFWQSPSESLL